MLDHMEQWVLAHINTGSVDMRLKRQHIVANHLRRGQNYVSALSLGLRDQL